MSGHGHAAGKMTPEYRAWRGMKERCHTETNRGYKYYGARGIRVCDLWRSNFLSFFNHVGPRPTKFHSIDRIDNSGNYEPGNVCWSDKKHQARNRRGRVLVPLNGRMVSLSEYCEVSGLPYDLIQTRMKELGWTFERAISCGPLRPGRRLTESDVKQIKALPKKNARLVAENYGVSDETIRNVWCGKTWKYV